MPPCLPHGNVAVISGVRPAPVLFLPGSVLPAELAYDSLFAALAPDDAVAKELEVYATPEPPPDYTLDLEVEGIVREASGRGLERFHLVGYSGGGAAALAFTAREPARPLSLALLEPAWAGFEQPVYYALGGLSNPDQFGEIASRLARVFPDFELEVFEKRHHFDPPHRIEPERLAFSLRQVWKRAEDRARDA